MVAQMAWGMIERKTRHAEHGHDNPKFSVALRFLHLLYFSQVLLPAQKPQAPQRASARPEQKLRPC